MSVIASSSGHRPGSWLALLTIALLVGACASPGPTASPAVTASPPPVATPSLAPTPTPPATPVVIVATSPPLPTETPSPPPTPVATPTPRPTSVPGLAISTVARAAADPAAAKTAASSITAFGLDLFRELLDDPSLTPRRTRSSRRRASPWLSPWPGPARRARRLPRWTPSCTRAAGTPSAGPQQPGPGSRLANAPWQDAESPRPTRPAHRQRRLLRSKDGRSSSPTST